MISRLIKGVEAVNDNFSAYKFGDAQQASYELWLNDLCDVHLELIKPIMIDTRDENKDARWASRATFWISLETGLRLLHPMMPYVTEELWQRLPGRGTLGESETTILAPYPECNNDYKSEEAEEAMATTYQIQNKVLTQFFVKISAREEMAKAQTKDIMTL
jgi:valyl-tRNA synthetase